LEKQQGKDVRETIIMHAAGDITRLYCFSCQTWFLAKCVLIVWHAYIRIKLPQMAKHVTYFTSITYQNRSRLFEQSLTTLFS